MAFFPLSPVLTRITSSTGRTKIFPSPMFPVQAALRMAWTTFSTSSSFTTTSTFVLWSRSTPWATPRHIRTRPFCLPRPCTSTAFRPTIPTFSRVLFTSPNFSLRMMASIFFISLLQPVARFAVLGEVQAYQFLHRAHPHPHKGVQDLEDDPGHDKGIGPDDDHRQGLDTELPGVAGEKAIAPRCVDGGGGKEPGGQGPPGAPDAVASPDIQRIIHIAPVPQADCQVAQDPRPRADSDGRQGANIARCRGDSHQPHHRPRCRPQEAGLARHGPAGEEPGQGGGGSGGIGDHKGAGGQCPCPQGTAGVEAKPAKPEEAGPQD